ncbi:ATP-binding cassette domain-containing protein [Streptomyces niveiscabiei]|uniref:ABC transporter ATP-binding protein n=1 Tax=Streptomyces TaxID=1883 RepID=UPI0019D309AD|nr:dipeptide/oligopeptide/nickel ABC transporter ATP-binding protein [Streptomyces sp. V2]
MSALVVEGRSAGAPLLAVEDLVVDYPAPGGPVRAVDHVGFSVPRGGSLAVVGESGCGKSTLARAIVRLLKPAGGRIVLDGTDLAALSERRLRPLRRRVQMVFQDPYGSLDPHLTAEETVAEPLRLAGVKDKAERRRRAAELLDRVGLPASALQRRPGEFSGGQRQRIGIARALASGPDLLVCDEATSALDVSVQAQVLDLLRELQAETGITYIVIAHHLGVVREISSEVVVLKAGRVVESGRTADVLASPADPYTRALRRAALEPAAVRGRKPRMLVAAVGAAPDGGSAQAGAGGSRAAAVSSTAVTGSAGFGAAVRENAVSDGGAPKAAGPDASAPECAVPKAASHEPAVPETAATEPRATEAAVHATTASAAIATGPRPPEIAASEATPPEAAATKVAAAEATVHESAAPEAVEPGRSGSAPSEGTVPTSTTPHPAPQEGTGA